MLPNHIFSLYILILEDTLNIHIVRKKLFYCLILTLALFVSACQKEETKPLSSSSADGSMTITVRGERMTSLDPYTAYITLKHDGEDMEVTTEVYADKLDASNVRFDWKSDESCLVIFTHRDGEKNVVPVEVKGFKK